MRKTIKISILFLFVFFVNGVFAQEETKEEQKPEKVFCINGEFRTRVELSPSAAGGNIMVPATIGGDDVDFGLTIWQRSRLGMNYFTKKLETSIEIQDVRAFGANMSPNSNYANLFLHKAWAKFNFINNDNRKLGLKIGRQVLDFDPRIIWHRNWNHYGASYDAINLQHTCKKDIGADMNLGLVYNSVDAPGTAASYRSLAFANIKVKYQKMLSVNLSNLYQVKEFNADTNFNINTFGFNPVFKKSGFKFDGGFYMKSGKEDSTINYSGMMYYVNVGYTIMDKYTVSVGFDNYSGEAWDDTTSNDVNKTFLDKSNYFGSYHKYFGGNDMHKVFFSANQGLQDIYFNFDAKITKKAGVTVGYHNISFAQNHAYLNTFLATPDVVEYKALGQNFDLVLWDKVSESVTFKAGYSLFLPSEDLVTETKIGYNAMYGMLETDNLKMQGWGWIMFIYKPKFFVDKKFADK